MVATAPQTMEINAISSDERWRAVLERDGSLDGAFVYGVRSTGIYCRPSCPSRKPQRQYVTFFAVPELAEQAGFRPCLRCSPEMHPSLDPQLELVRQVCRLISESAESADGSPTLVALAEGAGVSPHHLQKLFKRVTGITPRQYADALRLGTLKESLRNGWSVTDAIYKAGYGSSSRLYEQASAQLGMTPAAYRRGGQGMAISYALADCSLGKLLAAATERGICAVSLGDDEAALEVALRREFGAAQLQRDDSALYEWVEPVLQQLEGRRPHVDLPLDVQATAFQRIVWEQLRRIPYGETRSYSQIASAIGRPEASRAVAMACATNPAAVVIPCHRAVRQDGNLGGYRWGVQRKEKLLAQERHAAKM
jgi:AraC family transcriptional regulator of adaptative response/methylated-DNA-[protein]-cysteine methyltransferase